MKLIKTLAVFVVFSVLCIWFSESFFQSGMIKDEEGEKDESLSFDAEEKKIDYSNFACGEAFVTDVEVSAKSALLCSSDGLLIYEKNADIPLPMASITKVMTVICALESIEDLSKVITVPDAAVGIEGSSVYLAKGEKVTYEMLIYSAMLESANDAVTALAICVSGSIEAFVSQMNEKAQYLSMTNTHFCNPHGLNENEHFTTARDYVKLMSYALENETFCKVIATKKITFAKLDGSMTRVLTNHNRLLNTYSGMIGGKTGFTKVSGRTLITAAKRGDTVLICITLDAPSDWNDHAKMLDWGFETVKTVTFKADEIAKELQVGGGEQEKVRLIAVNDVSYTVRNEADVSVEYELPHITFAPVKLGQELGKAVFFCNGNKIAEVPLYAESSVRVPQPEEKGSISEKIKDLLRIKTE